MVDVFSLNNYRTPSALKRGRERGSVPHTDLGFRSAERHVLQHINQHISNTGISVLIYTNQTAYISLGNSESIGKSTLF